MATPSLPLDTTAVVRDSVLRQILGRVTPRTSPIRISKGYRMELSIATVTGLNAGEVRPWNG